MNFIQHSSDLRRTGGWCQAKLPARISTGVFKMVYNAETWSDRVSPDNSLARYCLLLLSWTKRSSSILGLKDDNVYRVKVKFKH